MLTHIDKEIYVNAYQIWSEDKDNNPRDFIDFVKKISDVIIYGEQDLSSSNILSKLLQNRGSTKIVRQTRKLTKEDIDESNPYQLFFLDVEDKGQREKLEKEIKYLLAFKDNYETVFEEFKSKPNFRVDKDGNVDKNSSVKLFKSWEQILPDLPITEIVISDPFIIMNQTEAKLENNLYGLFAAIKSKYKIESILVFTKIEHIDELAPVVKKARQIFGSKTICGFILFQGGMEHDRHILTNYKLITLGSSANYFDEEGNVTVKNTSNIDTLSYKEKENLDKATTILNGLNETLKDFRLNVRLPDKIKSRLLDYKEKKETD